MQCERAPKLTVHLVQFDTINYSRHIILERVSPVSLLKENDKI